jgi:hypothetical protein
MRLVMRRFTSVLISILLGALAVGVGMGYFLMKANNDRERLALIAQAAEQESQEAIQAREQAIKAANAKLDAANTEITKAQETIKAFNEERALIQSATVLRTPNAKEIKGWSEIVSLGQKATVNYPPTHIIAENSAKSLTLERPTSTTIRTGDDPRWLALMPYEAVRERELLNAFATSTSVSYLVDGRVLIGQRGTLAGDKNPMLVLRVRGGGQTTHLLWIRDPLGRTDSAALLNVLATLDFAD